MKNTWKAGLVVVALATSAGAAKADLTLNGQTGLFTNPTAEIAEKGAPEVAINYNRLNSDFENFSTLGVGFAFQPADKLELNAGLNRTSVGGMHFTDSRVGLKYQFVNNKDKGLDVAAGINYGSSFVIDQLTVFAAATKEFNLSHNRAPVKGTLGVRWDRLDLGGSSSLSQGSVYAGADVPLARDGKFSLVGEVGTKTFKYGESSYAIGVRYRPKSSGFSAAVGYGRLTSNGYVGLITSGSNTNNFFAQVGYKFGSK